MGLIRLAAIVALTIALLGSAAVFSGVDVQTWTIGGLLAWCVSSTADYTIPLGPRRQRRLIDLDPR